MERRTYINRVRALRQEENRLCEQLEKMQENRERNEEENRARCEDAKHTGKWEGLTREAVNEWIEAIYVYGKSQLDIVYKEEIKKD